MKQFLINLGILPISKSSSSSIESIYGIALIGLNGKPVSLEAFKGKKLLFVNVASKCAFTPQYKELQELHENFEDQLVIIGAPCNQFGNQEKGSNQEIEEFCSVNYGVSFLMLKKLNVRGEDIHPLYSWLTNSNLNGRKSSNVKWNFQKYLVDENGQLIDLFLTTTKVSSKTFKKYIKK
jgi:glutathione peroxidase